MMKQFVKNEIWHVTHPMTYFNLWSTVSKINRVTTQQGYTLISFDSERKALMFESQLVRQGHIDFDH